MQAMKEIHGISNNTLIAPLQDSDNIFSDETVEVIDLEYQQDIVINLTSESEAFSIEDHISNCDNNAPPKALNSSPDPPAHTQITFSTATRTSPEDIIRALKESQPEQSCLLYTSPSPRD